MLSHLSKTWARAREKGLRVCAQYAVEQVDPRVGYPAARLQYLFRIARGRPYFGQLYAAAQGAAAGAHNIERGRAREIKMRQLVAAACSQKGAESRILEVGSWAGWSAIVWANALKDLNRKDGRVVCVDPWASYLDLKANPDPVYRAMAAATRRDAIVGLFHHNVRSAGQSDVVHAFRGTSDECLPMLRGSWFDLVFIDGDHSYDAVKRDLANAGRLVRSGGILAGDDLDLQFGEVHESDLRRQLGYDFPLDPSSDSRYHPGVTLAVWEFFNQRVSSWDGLWAMRKTEGGWEQVCLPAG